MIPPEGSPSRHHLAWLRPAWRDLLRAPLDPTDRAALSGWFARGLPAVVARRLPGDGDAVRLGVALAGEERRRVALVVARDAIGAIAPPLALREVVRSAPDRWVPRLRALDRSARDAGLVLRVYGSLAWQHLSGEERVGADSDLDLLVRPRDAAQLLDALRLLRDHWAGAAPALDGEILLPGGRAVAWRELASGARTVLVRTDSALALEPRDEVLRGMEVSC